MRSQGNIGAFFAAMNLLKTSEDKTGGIGEKLAADYLKTRGFRIVVRNFRVRFGEDLAAIYLKNQGYKIISCNFRTKFGELDIVCQKGRLLIFVEVKAVQLRRLQSEPRPLASGLSGFSPEQHFTKQKITRLKRAIEIFLIKNKLSSEIEQRLDLIALELDVNGKLKDLRHYENVSDVF